MTNSRTQSHDKSKIQKEKKSKKFKILKTHTTGRVFPLIKDTGGSKILEAQRF